MNNGLEEKILEKVKLKLAISSFEEKECRNMNIKTKRFFQTAAVACCAMFSITGIVFAEDISGYFKNLFGTNISDGVSTALEKGYVANMETEYQEANGISIKVDNILMDDFNLAIDFNVKLDEKFDINKFKTMILEDLKIVDETGKIVFVTHEYDINQEYLGAYNVSTRVIDKNNLILSFVASGNIEAFPKSKELKIIFNKINTYDSSNQINNSYTGNWNFELEVPKEFYNRETVIYKVKNCNDDNTQLNKAILSNTGLKITLTTTTGKIDINEFHSTGKKEIFKNAYVETSDGKIYGVSRSN